MVPAPPPEIPQKVLWASLLIPPGLAFVPSPLTGGGVLIGQVIICFYLWFGTCLAASRYF